MDLPSEVPVMILPNATLFPHSMLPLYIFEERYRSMMEDVLASERVFSVALRRQDRPEETPCAVAGLGMVRAAIRNGDGTFHVMMEGLIRIRLVERVDRRPYQKYRVEPVETVFNSNGSLDSLTGRLLDLVQERHQQLCGQENPDPCDSQSDPTEEAFEILEKSLKRLGDQGQTEMLTDLVSCTLIPNHCERQNLLSMPRLDSRLRFLIQHLSTEVERHRSDSAPGPDGLA